jgi:putative ABC transport system permease protein
MRADAFTQEKTKFIVVGEKFSLLVTFITIIAVALGLINTMVTTGFEKRKFLAILLALGWRKYEIALLFLAEALIVAILGGALGLVLGFKGMAYIFSMSSIGAFVPVLSMAMMAKITAALLGVSLVAAVIPVWINLNFNPVEVIRGE